ncbi:MAG: sigma-70 family RNA polymerase sigma factor [Clostridia bacterium]|nr:sigma-70 family RNA polymerase sigma factor [Clostridia bacterium]
MRLASELVGTRAFADVMAQLWENNLPLIRRTVRETTGLTASEMEYEDMLQEAYISFQAAAQTYKSSGVKCGFATFFSNRVRWDLIRYYTNNGFAVRIPAYMRQIIQKVFEKKHQLEAEQGTKITCEAAIIALGLSSVSASSVLAAIRKAEIVSMDEMQDSDGASLLDILQSSEDVAECAVAQEWHRELHSLIMQAIQEIPADAQSILIRHFFQGVSYTKIAQEMHCCKQSVDKKRSAAFKRIRGGRYAPILSEFLPDMDAKRRADHYINQTRAEIEKLQLTSEEQEILAI